MRQPKAASGRKGTVIAPNPNRRPAMNARSPRRAAVPTAGIVLLAGLGLAFAGCDERSDRHVREDRVASILPLAPQSALRIETRCTLGRRQN